MDIFNILTLLGGVALFLYGMKVMGAGLELVSGSGLQRTLEKLSDNKLKGVLLGAGVTAIIQSSAATTVMVVGFVNSGIMKLAHAIGIIMGANIGTTATAWILSLTGIQGDSVWVQLLKPSNFAPLFAFVGIALIMLSKNSRRRDIGTICVGFGVLMFGMTTMIDAMGPITEMEGFQDFVLMFTNPFLGLLMGFVLTTVLQSSSASIGIMQAMSITGNVTLGFSIPLILGQNIGSCTTTLISCIGANKNARRAALVHLYFNLIGVVVVFVLFYGLNAIFKFTFLDMPLNVVTIAVLHSVFNVLTTFMLLPFSKLLSKLAELSVPDKKGEDDEVALLDERLLKTPSFAIEHCRKLTVQMAELANDSFKKSVDMLWQFSEKTAEKIEANEAKIDMYEDKLGNYLVELSGRSLSEHDSHEVSRLLYTIGDFERIGDHAVNILKTARELRDKGTQFSESAKTEVITVISAVEEILDMTLSAFAENNTELAGNVEPLEQVIDGLCSEVKSRHVMRLQQGVCTIELGFALADLLTNFGRVSDHCSNIAICVLQMYKNVTDAHKYLNDVKSSMRPDFVIKFEKFSNMYELPQAEKANV